MESTCNESASSEVVAILPISCRSARACMHACNSCWLCASSERSLLSVVVGASWGHAHNRRAACRQEGAIGGHLRAGTPQSHAEDQGTDGASCSQHGNHDRQAHLSVLGWCSGF